MKFLERFMIVSGGGSAALAAERHYLPFNGSTDYGIADAVFGSITGDYAFAMKIAGVFGSPVNGVYVSVGGPGAADLASHDRFYATSSTAMAEASFNATTSASIISQSVTGLSNVASVVYCRRSDPSSDIRVAQASAIVHTSNPASTIPNTPDHFTIGARVKNDLVTVSNYGAPQFISAILTDGAIPDADLIAWLDGTDAEDHINGINHYWCASDIAGSSIPARVGTVPLTLVGLVAGDLVAWP